VIAGVYAREIGDDAAMTRVRGMTAAFVENERRRLIPLTQVAPLLLYQPSPPDAILGLLLRRPGATLRE
jgi:hypothetical protein